MSWLFSAVGGQGSHFLINQLRRRYLVADKPDNALWRTLPGVDLSVPVTDQGQFTCRSLGYPAPPEVSLLELFPHYVAWLRDRPGLAAVFGLSAEFGLFSEHAVKDVVFLFRNPSDAYASWAKPERHGGIVEYLGGLTSPMAVSYYCDRWRKAAREFLSLAKQGLKPRMIRYEYAPSDASQLGLGWAYADFELGRRNDSMVSRQLSAMIAERTADEVNAIYFRNPVHVMG